MLIIVTKEDKISFDHSETLTSFSFLDKMTGNKSHFYVDRFQYQKRIFGYLGFNILDGFFPMSVCDFMRIDFNRQNLKQTFYLSSFPGRPMF